MTFTGKLPLKLITSRGEYFIQLPEQSGGKAGKGHNKTSNIQVMWQGVFAVKQVRYNIADLSSKTQAIKKAIAYVIGQVEAQKYFK